MKNTSTQQKLSTFKCNACKRHKEDGRSEAFIDKEDKKNYFTSASPPLGMPALGGDRSCLPSVQVSLLWTPSSSTSPQAPRHFEIERKIINPPLYFLISSLSIKVWSLTQYTPPLPLDTPFTLHSCKLCHIYASRNPFKRTPSLEYTN